MTPPTGRQFELRHGDQRAVAVEMGGGLREYRVGAREVLDGYRADEECTAARGQLLIPWPNRIDGGRYRFGGEPQQLVLTEPDRGNAIHGLVRSAPWSCAESSESSVTLTYELAPQPGYPFALSLRVEYELDDGGLRSRITARNVGSSPCPYGAGIHPYIRVGEPTIDSALLRVPAECVLVTNERGIPVGRPLHVDGTPFDFRSARQIGDLVLDTGYANLPRDRDSRARVALMAGDGGAAVTVWMDAVFDFVMVFTGDTLAPDRRRRGVGIEPMTCAPDAFNSGRGLVALEPGESHSCSWGVEAG